MGLGSWLGSGFGGGMVGDVDCGGQKITNDNVRI